MKAEWEFRRFRALLLGVLLAGCTTVFGPDTAFNAERATAIEAVSSFYASGDATRWRMASLKEIQAIRSMSTADVDAAITSYRNAVKRHALNGYEGVVFVAVGELAARGADGRRLALRQLEGWPQGDQKPVAPPANAYVPVVRSGNPVVHYLPYSLVRGVFNNQLVSKTVDPDGAIKEDFCTEEGLSQYERQFGEEKAEALRAFCQVDSSGLTTGFADPGIMPGLSVLDCLLDKEPTRAEQITVLLRACANSLESGGDPIASSGIGDRTEEGFRDHRRRVRDRERAIESGQEVRTERRDDPDTGIVTIEEYDAQGALLTRIDIKPSGDTTVSYYNEQQEKFFVATYQGAEGAVDAGEDTRTEEQPVNWTYAEVYEDENGNATNYATESVQINDDGSYTVTRYNPDGSIASQQTYGTDNQPAGGGASSGFEGWGTSPECRAFNLALLENRGLNDLQAGGFVSRTRVNPAPDDPGARPGGLDEPSDIDCLAIDNGQPLDDTFQCRRVVSCAQDALPSGDNCDCRANSGRRPSLACKAQMVCADGTNPVAGPNGYCFCENEEDVLYEERTLGGGPLPVAIRNLAP